MCGRGTDVSNELKTRLEAVQAQPQSGVSSRPRIIDSGDKEIAKVHSYESFVSIEPGYQGGKLPAGWEKVCYYKKDSDDCAQTGYIFHGIDSGKVKQTKSSCAPQYSQQQQQPAAKKEEPLDSSCSTTNYSYGWP